MTENNGRDNGGRFLPGNSGKPKGSSKNKLRDEIKTFLGDQWPSFPVWFEALKPRDKIEVMLDLMPYAVPRLQAIAMTDSEGNEIPKEPSIDYTKLSESTLREIIAATTLNENE